ncbi:MAG: molybdenum cofactor biosynthesis protein MoaE [Planctomycetota bacterium]|nr:MAG: molybdenum cofactor biosynthesis protein MoaE [Planctomycetota bacterium]
MTGEVEHPESGALLTFAGVVRSETNDAGQPLLALEYTAYEPMALAEMQRIVEQTAAEFDLNGVRFVHRLGTLAVGEASVLAVVSSGHRAAGFDACRALIERLKESVPIFKREIWADGSRTWVEGDASS